MGVTPFPGRLWVRSRKQNRASSELCIPSVARLSQWCGRDPWLSAHASQRGWLFGKLYYRAVLCRLTSDLGEGLTTKSKVHSNWNTQLSLKQSTFCGPQRSQNIEAQRGGMHGMVKRMDLVRRVNAGDFLSHIAGLGVWEHTSPMRTTGMDRAESSRIRTLPQSNDRKLWLHSCPAKSRKQ
jgi:hypothetical protein